MLRRRAVQRTTRLKPMPPHPPLPFPPPGLHCPAPDQAGPARPSDHTTPTRRPTWPREYIGLRLAAELDDRVQDGNELAHRAALCHVRNSLQCAHPTVPYGIPCRTG